MPTPRLTGHGDTTSEWSVSLVQRLSGHELYPLAA